MQYYLFIFWFNVIVEIRFYRSISEWFRLKFEYEEKRRLKGKKKRKKKGLLKVGKIDRLRVFPCHRGAHREIIRSMYSVANKSDIVRFIGGVLKGKKLKGKRSGLCVSFYRALPMMNASDRPPSARNRFVFQLPLTISVSIRRRRFIGIDQKEKKEKRRTG